MCKSEKQYLEESRLAMIHKITVKMVEVDEENE